MVIKARKSIAAKKVLTAANCEQRHLVHLYQDLILSETEYALAILTLSLRQMGRLERIRNEVMLIILGRTKDGL